MVAVALLAAVSRFGYLGIGALVFIESFGIPAPGETAIIAGSAYAAGRHLNVVAVAVTAFLAAVTGDTVGYLIGRTGGRGLVLRFGRYVRLTPARLRRVERFMARRGPLVVVLARFVEGLRQLNGVVAGISRMPWPRFVLCNAVGAALWVSVWSTAGYLAGNHIDRLSAVLHRYLTYAVLLGALLVAAYLVVHLRRQARHRAADEAEDRAAEAASGGRAGDAAGQGW
jgi:membrane protein DedA with SNARE-associated domain